VLCIDVNHAELISTAVAPAQYPAAGLPEFAFVGKSNVGKSSLLNAMAGRKALARTSGSPGKTRVINFFNINNMCLFVDLPGYGYAKISRQESKKWGGMIERYLLGRQQLLAIFLLLDIRHDLSELDRQMLDWLNHYGFDIIAITTKSDKIKKNTISRRLSYFREVTNVDSILSFSSKSKEGRNVLWSIIENRITHDCKL